MQTFLDSSHNKLRTKTKADKPNGNNLFFGGPIEKGYKIILWLQIKYFRTQKDNTNENSGIFQLKFDLNYCLYHAMRDL